MMNKKRFNERSKRFQFGQQSVGRRYFHRMKRFSPQKMYNPEPRARHANVMFNLDASSTASDVGREKAKMTGIRARAAFCTNS
jgi:hypothetical protein